MTRQIKIKINKIKIENINYIFFSYRKYIMGAGVLPVAIYRGTLLLLLGQERHNNLWADFGGSHNKGEKPFNTAIREGMEELNGLLGNENEFEETVTNNMVLTISYDKYTTYIFGTRYDKYLPMYFYNSNKFAEIHLSNLVAKDHNGLFEKKCVRWFTMNELKNEATKKKLRRHYVEIVNSIIKNEKLIIKHLNQLDTSVKITDYTSNY